MAQTKFKRRFRDRFYLGRKQRSAGRHLIGPVYYTTEFHRHPKYTPVVYWNLTVGNPKVHAKWAFSFTIYFRR